jgi:hypothetical protein
MFDFGNMVINLTHLISDNNATNIQQIRNELSSYIQPNNCKIYDNWSNYR